MQVIEAVQIWLQFSIEMFPMDAKSITVREFNINNCMPTH